MKFFTSRAIHEKIDMNIMSRLPLWLVRQQSLCENSQRITIVLKYIKILLKKLFNKVLEISHTN